MSIINRTFGQPGQRIVSNVQSLCATIQIEREPQKDKLMELFYSHGLTLDYHTVQYSAWKKLAEFRAFKKKVAVLFSIFRVLGFWVYIEIPWHGVSALKAPMQTGRYQDCTTELYFKELMSIVAHNTKSSLCTALHFIQPLSRYYF